MQRISFRTNKKKEWINYCVGQGISSSEALRQMIQKLVTGTTDIYKILNVPKGITPSPQGGKNRHRVEISFTDAEYQKVFEHAKKNGFSPSKWLITLVRYQFIKHTPLTVIELDKLDERLYQIRMIGQNLNQITRALNSHELHPSQVDVKPLLEQLLLNINEEKHTLNTIFKDNLERW